MKSAHIILILLCLQSLTPILLDAQKIIDESKSRVSNAEPTHAYYVINEGNSSSFTLEQVEEEGLRHSYTFQFQPGWVGQQVFVRLDGIYAPYDFRINGFTYGLWNGQGPPVEFNVTPFLKKDTNIIELVFDQKQGALLAKSIEHGSLISRDPVHIRDIRVTSYSSHDSPETLVRIHLHIQSYLTQRNKGRILSMTILNPDKTAVGTQTKTLDFPLGYRQEMEFTFDQTINNPRLWSPQQPDRYSLKLQMVEKGNSKGEMVSTTFGIRNVSYEDSILVINRDTLIPFIANQAFLKELRDQPESMILDLFHKEGFNAAESSEFLPERIMELFDQHGIVVLKREKDRDPESDRPDSNRPSIVWFY